MKKIFTFLLNYYAIEIFSFFAFAFFIYKQVEVKPNLFTPQEIAYKISIKKTSKQTTPYLIIAFGRIVFVSIFTLSTFLTQDKPSQQ